MLGKAASKILKEPFSQGCLELLPQLWWKTDSAMHQTSAHSFFPFYFFQSVFVGCKALDTKIYFHPRQPHGTMVDCAVFSDDGHSRQWVRVSCALATWWMDSKEKAKEAMNSKLHLAIPTTEIILKARTTGWLWLSEAHLQICKSCFPSVTQMPTPPPP